MNDILTVPQAAKELGVDPWKVRRLFETGDLPEPSRHARARAIPRCDIPAIRTALAARGWLSPSSEDKDVNQ